MPTLPAPADRGAFRRMYSNLVRKATNGKLEVSPEKQDDWIIIRQRSLTYIHVGHKVNHSHVDLALFDYNFGYVGDATPPGAEDVSTEKTRMFRWTVAPVDWTAHPAGQIGVREAIERAVFCFEWVQANKLRPQGAWFRPARAGSRTVARVDGA